MRMRKLPWAQDFLKEQEVVVPDASALAGAWKQTLKRAELHVEIGTGKGDYWVQMAQKYPDIAWVGVEKTSMWLPWLYASIPSWNSSRTTCCIFREMPR